ncbi:MAG: hypothetical protein Q8R55_06695 [Candidatus Taylorbacteria bacterium]|nr:hypothetical protein [Candidatus Taylorbacteria bacterium]
MTSNYHHIISITSGLSKPHSSYAIKGVIFNIYLAKKWGSSKWMDPCLRKLTLEFRLAYLRYGNRSLLDKYDIKAGIYLISAEYKVRDNQGKSHAVKEWLSIRFVPARGRPNGSGELEIYYFGNKRLDQIAKQKLFKGDIKFQDHIFSSSRMCGVSPYFVKEEDETEEIDISKHNHIPICFALIQHQFITDYFKTGKMSGYISEIIRNDFAAKALTFKRGKIKCGSPSIPAHKTLNLDPSKIKLNRKVYTYKFPTYWLNIGRLIALISTLIKDKILSDKSVKYYLKINADFKDLIKNGSASEMIKLSNLLTVNGKIKYSKLTGVRLRSLIDQNVDDGPELKLTGIKTWNLGINKILDMAGVSTRSFE